MVVEIIESVIVDTVEVPEEQVEAYLLKGYKRVEVKTRNYWGKPPLYVLTRIR